MTACRMLRSPSISAAASRTTTSRRMPAPTSGTATSRRPSTCRWAWSGRSSCGRGRTACRPATASTPRWQAQQGDLRTACNSAVRHPVQQSVCRRPTRVKQGLDQAAGSPQKYAYNDGDGSTAYDVEYPIQIHGFDPNFHFVGMTFNPEGFRRHEGQVLPPERPQLSGHGHVRVRRQRSPRTAECTTRSRCLDHQHSGRRQGSAADFRSRRDRIPDARLARHSDAGRSATTPSCCATRQATTCTTTRTRSRSAAANRST